MLPPKSSGLLPSKLKGSMGATESVTERSILVSSFATVWMYLDVFLYIFWYIFSIAGFVCYLVRRFFNRFES